MKTLSLDLSLIVSCYNEEDNILNLAKSLLAVFVKCDICGEIILVNDASSDQTRQLVDSIVKAHSEIRVIHHEKNCGLSAAWDSGLALAQGTYVCFMDATLQHPAEEIEHLYRELLFRNVDLVQGVQSCIAPFWDSRYFLHRGLNVILNLAFGMRATDNESKLALALRDTMSDVLSRNHQYHEFHTFIRVAAEAKGYKVHEVEIFESNTQSHFSIPKKSAQLILKVFIDIIKALDEYRFRKKSHEPLQEFLRYNSPLKEPQYSTGWRRVLFELYFATMPFHKWMITRRSRKMYFDLKRTEWLSSKQIRELQIKRLKRLIHHAYYHVPYYRNAMESLGVKPSDIQTLDDITRLPLLSKTDVRSNLYFDLFSDTHSKKNMLRIATSGSTGQPFVTYAEQTQLEMRFATTLRSMEWTGWRFGDKQARLWHQTIGMSWSKIIREKLDAWFMRRLFIPAFEMRDNNLEVFIKRLRDYKPLLVDGYAESLNFLAYYVKQNNIDAFKPIAIVSSAQTLPEQSRKTIEERFQTKVFDKYGSREFSGIAYECEYHDGHHIMAESYIVEILKDNRSAQPGEVGEVAITDLNNFLVPLIRYRIGDLATAMDNSKPCACGRCLPRIGRIEGRVQSIVFCPNRTWVPGAFFSHFFKDYDLVIEQFQIIQHQVDIIDLKVVKGWQFSESVMEDILERLKEFLGQEMFINVQYVEKIPLGQTGKRTSVLSKLNFDFQDICDLTGLDP
ncbi:glycosyltransferase [Nostoc sp.]